MNRNGLKKWFKLNKHGATLAEAIVSIALICIVSLGVTTMYFSLSRISKMSNRQLEINGIMQVTRDNVLASIRAGADIEGNSSKPARGNSYNGLTVKDLSGMEYTNYCFDLDYIGSNDYFGSGKLLEMYRITIRKATTLDYITDFCVEIYP